MRFEVVRTSTICDEECTNYVEFNTLEGFISWVNLRCCNGEWGVIVIPPDKNDEEDMYRLEIYDNWRE